MLTMCHNAYAPKGANASYTYSLSTIATLGATLRGPI
jgi:hypothetical protein